MPRNDTEPATRASNRALVADDATCSPHTRPRYPNRCDYGQLTITVAPVLRTPRETRSVAGWRVESISGGCKEGRSLVLWVCREALWRRFAEHTGNQGEMTHFWPSVPFTLGLPYVYGEGRPLGLTIHSSICDHRTMCYWEEHGKT